MSLSGPARTVVQIASGMDLSGKDFDIHALKVLIYTARTMKLRGVVYRGRADRNLQWNDKGICYIWVGVRWTAQQWPFATVLCTHHNRTTFG